MRSNLNTCSPALLAGLLLAAGLPSQVTDIHGDIRVGGARIERRVVAMGTHLRLEVAAAGRPAALAATEQVIAAVQAIERRLSTWRDDSELAHWNRARVGQPVSISPALTCDLAVALRWSRVTGGAFDPGVGALVAAWGLRTGGRQPTDLELRAARASGGALSALQIDGHRATRQHAALQIEEGGFAKGIALDAALAALATSAAVTSAYLDFGGQVAVLGEPQCWALADPRDRQRPVCSLRISHGSLATSGNSERGIEVDGRRLGHLLDPRTGRPAPDFGSLAVWAPSATAADCLSTGLYVLGPARALAFAAETGECEVVVLEVREGRLRVRASAGLRDRLDLLVPDLAIEFTPAPLGAASPSRTVQRP